MGTTVARFIEIYVDPITYIILIMGLLPEYFKILVSILCSLENYN